MALYSFTWRMKNGFNCCDSGNEIKEKQRKKRKKN